MGMIISGVLVPIQGADYFWHAGLNVNEHFFQKAIGFWYNFETTIQICRLENALTVLGPAGALNCARVWDLWNVNEFGTAAVD